jgi:hypothetical protein
MAIDRTRTLRGALAGAAAAAVWAAQQPLDKRVFGVDYDDCELLGTLVTRRRAAYPVGIGLHLGNGAVFGALYATAAPSLPGPRPAQGVVTAMVEHLATWPLMGVSDRLHPARGHMPALWGSGRAFALATWRHLLFGFVLGEVERRLNPPAEPPGPVDEETAATNGHGSIEHLVPAGPVS